MKPSAKTITALAALLLLASASASLADNECMSNSPPPGFNCWSYHK